MKILDLFDKIKTNFLTNAVGKSEITETRDTNGSENREMTEKLIIESFHCPYCGSTKFVKRGFRQKKREKIQLYLCSSCQKTFTPYSTKGKRYPMEVVIDALSIYNLGYSLEQTCRIVNNRSYPVIARSETTLARLWREAISKLKIAALHFVPLAMT